MHNTPPHNSKIELLTLKALQVHTRTNETIFSPHEVGNGAAGMVVDCVDGVGVGVGVGVETVETRDAAACVAPSCTLLRGDRSGVVLPAAVPAVVVEEEEEEDPE